MNYVRFIIAFPLEALKRNLTIWKTASCTEGVHLPFDRAVGTAMVYAFLDVKNVVGHVEMGSRIYDAAQLPWIMPTGPKTQILKSKTCLGHACKPNNPKFEHKKPPGACLRALATGFGGHIGALWGLGMAGPWALE